MKSALLTSLCLAAAMSGCANYRAYDGETRMREDVAVIEGDLRFNAGLPVTVLLRKVDEQTLDVQHRGVEVLPGDHTLIVDCLVRESGSTARFELEVSVAAGRRYGLTAELAPGLRGCARVELEPRD